MKRVLHISFLCLLVPFADPACTAVKGGCAAPEFSPPDLAGKTFGLSEYRGKAMLLILGDVLPSLQGGDAFPELLGP